MKIASAFLFTFVSACVLQAQSTAGFGSISGTLRDATGASIPNAKVVISNPAKGITRTLNSNDAGVFTAPALVPGSGYGVAVDVQGFAKYEQKNLTLAVGQNIDLNVTLAVAGTATEVEVSAT